MVAFRPPDSDNHRRTRASQRSAPKPAAPPRARRSIPWRALAQAADQHLAARPEIPLCIGLLLIAATLTVLREGTFDGLFPRYYYDHLPSKEAVRWIRFIGAALAIVGTYYRLSRYKH